MSSTVKLNTKGISLVETLFAIGLFVAASLILWSFVTNFYRTQNFSMDQSSAVTEAQRGVETMVKELRETLPADNGAYPIATAENQNLIFYADFDRDSAIEKIHYWLDGSNLKKGVTKPSGSPLAYNPANEKITILSRYVRNGSLSIFTYRDGNYNQLAVPADIDSIKLVHVQLKIDVYPDKAPMLYDLESDVALRNLKENL
jgi:hypothetical protein